MLLAAVLALPSAPVHADDGRAEAAAASSPEPAADPLPPESLELFGAPIGHALVVRQPALRFTPDAPPSASSEAVGDLRDRRRSVEVLATTGSAIRVAFEGRAARLAVWLDHTALATLVVSDQRIATGDHDAAFEIASGVEVIRDSPASPWQVRFDEYDLEVLVDVEVPSAATGVVSDEPPNRALLRMGDATVPTGTVLRSRPSKLGLALVRIAEGEAYVERLDEQPVDGYRRVRLGAEAGAVVGWVEAAVLTDNEGGAGQLGGAGGGFGFSSHAAYRHPYVGALLYPSHDAEQPVGVVHTKRRMKLLESGETRDRVQAVASGLGTVGVWVDHDDLSDEPSPP